MTKRYELTPSMNLEGKSNGALIKDNQEQCKLVATEVCLELNKQDEQIQRLESRLSIATQLLKQFKLYYIFMDKLEDVEEIHHWSKEDVVTDDNCS